jgi:hypothetical protein
MTKRAAEILEDQGKSMQVISGFRTGEEQQAAYQRYITGRGGIAAKPGMSNHEWGGAIDVQPGPNTSFPDIQNAMNQAARETGAPLSTEHARLGARDPGHFSIVRPDAGGQVAYTPPAKLPFEKRLQIGSDYVANTFPNNPIIETQFRQRFAAENAVEDHIAREQELEIENTLDQGLQDRGDGQSPTNWDQFIANPPVQRAWAALARMPDGATKQVNYYGRFHTFIQRGLEQTDQDYKTYLQGLISDHNVAELMDIDPKDSAIKLSQRDRQWLIRQKAAVRRADAERDPYVNRVLKAMASKIADPVNNMDRTGNAAQQKNYYTYVGAVAQELEQNYPDGGKGLTTKQMEEIGNRLFYQETVTAPGRLWGTRQVTQPLYQHGYNLPPAEREEIRRDLIEKTPYSTPTDRDINIEAARRAFDALKAKSP